MAVDTLLTPPDEGKSELDSHADTCCAGANTALIEFTGETVKVQPFSPEYDSYDDVPIATVATAYDDPDKF